MKVKPDPLATPRRYHHGDLRQAVIDAGLALLVSRPLAELGLREVAREVGVSATALYRHFADKQALKTALAQAGLDRLAQAQQAASAQAGGGAAGFQASGLAYVRFAVDQPVLFRLVFSHAQPDEAVLDLAPERMSDALRCLRQDIAALLPPGRPAAEHKAAALHAWALVHGLALLVLDRQIPDDPALIQQVLQGFSGVLQRPQGPKTGTRRAG